MQLNPRRTPPFGKTLALTLVVLFTIAPWVDAALEGQSVEDITHVESQSEAPCAPGHDEVMCQLCKLVQIPGHTGEHAEHRLGTAVPRANLDVVDAAPKRILQPSTGPRAPPLS